MSQAPVKPSLQSALEPPDAAEATGRRIIHQQIVYFKYATRFCQSLMSVDFDRLNRELSTFIRQRPWSYNAIVQSHVIPEWLKIKCSKT